jgi:predicted DCC family thiol-disulfide oxidoreductase YuxK
MANVEASVTNAAPAAGGVPPDRANAAATREASPARSTDRATEVVVPVVFFDGVCGLCNRFVNFVIRRDSLCEFRFSPLQGETARERLAAADVRDLKTVVLVDGEGTHRKSTAVLRVLGRLGGFWRAVAAVLRLVPRPLRDVGYSWIAGTRYAIFGKKETCRLPTPAERGRFLP